MPLYSLGACSPALPDEGFAWIAPSADVIGEVKLGSCTSIWFGAVIRADNTPIIVGARSNVQEGAILHSDPGFPLVIGEDVTVGHRAVLHGCTVGDRVLIGMGALVLNGVQIGADSIVGAGALVTQGKQFPPRSLIAGSPATVRRELNEDELQAQRSNACEYVDKRVIFAAQLRRQA